MAKKHTTVDEFLKSRGIEKKTGSSWTSPEEFLRKKQSEDEYKRYKEKAAVYEKNREAFQTEFKRREAQPSNELRSSTYVGLKHGPNQVLINNTVKKQQEAEKKTAAEDKIFSGYSLDRQKSTIENLQKQLDYAKDYDAKKKKGVTSEKGTLKRDETGRAVTESGVDGDYIADLEAKIKRYSDLYYANKNETQLSQMEKLPEQKAQYEAASQTDADNEVIKRVLDKVNTGNFEWDEDYEYVAEKFGITTDNKSMEQYRDELMAVLDEGKQFVSDTATELEKLDFDYEGLENYKAMLKAQEEYDAQVERARQNYEDRPFLTNLQTVANAPGMAVEAIAKGIKSIGHNDPADFENYRPMNKYNMPVTTYVQAVRQATDEDIDSEVLSFLYNTGMSVADSTVLALTFGPAATVAMGGASAASYMQEAVDRGLSNKQILTGAIATGAAEALAEYAPINKLLNGAMNAATVKELLKAIGVQAATEGIEEMLTEGANILSDAIITGRNSKNAQLVKQYMADGMTKEEAKKKVFWDNVKNVLLAGLGGALSGGVSAAGLGGANVIGEKMSQRNMPKFDAQTQTLLENAYETYASSTSEPIAFENYAKEFEIAYEYGKGEVGKEYVMQKRHTPHMSDAQLENAYDAGVIARLKEQGKNNVESEDAQSYNMEENNGEKVHLREVSNGLDGENTGGQIRQLEESAGRNQSGLEKSRPADSETASLTYSEKVSEASLGIEGGSKNAHIRIVKSGETKAIKNAKAQAKSRGLELVLFAGDNLQISQKGEDGKTYDINARAFIVGNKVYARVDHPDFTSEQLVKHEIGHDMIDKGEINPNVVRERIDKEFTKARADAIVDKYIEAYEGSGMSPEEIWTELICDSLADMNVFSKTDYEQSEKVLQPAIKEAIGKTKAESTRGPPANSKTSVEVLPDGKKYVRADRQVIFGNDPDSWSEQLETYINNKIRKGENVTLIAVDGDLLTLTEDTAGKISSPYKDGGRISDGDFERKVSAGAHIDELAMVSTRGKKDVKDVEARHGETAKDGWNYRTAFFLDFDGTYYRCTISVSKGKNGNAVYNIGEMKKRSFPTVQKALSGSSANGGAQRGKTSSEVKIAHNGSSVKGKASREIDLHKEREGLLEEIQDKRKEQQRLSAERYDIENSDEYKELFDRVSKEPSPDSIKEYSDWVNKNGLTAIIEKSKTLSTELNELHKRYNELYNKIRDDEEKEAIAKSGLDEADYFRKQAVKEFGYTPYFYDAGYLLPNGKLLNFSGEKGKHYGMRGEDHRGIGVIYANTQGTAALIRFMNDGNIRVMAETPGLDIFAKAEPTSEQYSTIRKFINEYAKEGFFSIDFSDENGRSVGSLTYENSINATRIVNDVKHYYSTGELRGQSLVSQFHFSRELTTDSDGEKLSKGQQEYFKDSKERDNKGYLRVMYRGGNEDFTVFDRRKSKYSNLYGRGFYFTNSKNHAEQYGKAKAFYLNITNPVSTSETTITRAQMRKFLKAVAGNEDDYSFENYGYEATVDGVLRDVYSGKSDFAMLYDVAQTAIGDMVEAVELFNKVNSTNYDGFILDTETVIFNSEQAKNVDNKNPTSNPDIRFSREIPGIEKLRKEHERKRTDSTVLSNAVNALDMSVFNASEKAVLDRFTERLKKIRETEEAIAKYREQGDNISVEDRNRMHNAEARTVKMYSELYESLDKKGVKAVASKATELLVQKYGSIEPGEKPFREVSVPARTNKGNKVSQTVRTAMEAEATSDEMVERLTEEVVKGGFSYIPITDAESKKYADDTIKRKGWNDALLDWAADVNKNQLGKNNVALGFQLYNNALNAGDTETAVRILTDLAARVREGAQMVQAVRMLKKLSPEYQLYGIQRSIQTLQDSLNERYGDKAPQLEMDSQLVKNYEQAETEEARTAAQEAIYRHVAAQIPHTFMDKWNSWRYLAMLFNPRTHVRNILGNAMFAPVRGAKNATAALIEKLIPQEQRTKAIASGSKLYKAAFEDYKIVADQITGAGKYNDAIGEIERMKPAFGSSKIAKPFNWLANANSFALEAEDMWFSRPAYASALAGYLKARNITDMSTMQQSELDKARAYAIKEAQKATYRDFNDFSNFISAIGRKSKAKNKVVAAAQTVAEGVLPFRRTPANILVRGIEYSPVGLAKGIVQAARGVKKGTATAAEAIDSIASGLVGSALLGLGIFLVKQGVLSAGEDKDKKQQEFDELMGGQNYALTVGDKNFTIDWLAPEALPMFVGAEIANVLIENDGEFNLAAVLEGVSRISEPMLEMSMLSSLQDVIENVSYSDGKLMGILVNAFTSYLSQGLPTLAGQIERVTETERETTWVDRNKTQIERDIQYLLGKSANKTPGEYQQIPYIDAWGRRESTGTVLARVFNNMLNPAYVSEDVSTPTDNELQRLYDLGFDEVFPSSVSQSDKIDGEYLSADEYVKYAETRGKRQRELIEDITSADWYDKLDDTEKSEVIKKAYDYAAETAKRDVKETHEVPKWAQEVEKTSDKAESIKNYALNLASEEMSSTAITKYYEEIESTGIEFDVYKDYYVRKKEAKGTDADGDGKTDSGSKKEAVMDIINSLNISRDQKDVLYLLDYSESTIDDAPWH
ncbi:MAG: hypothetical protein J6S23_04325 [Clostridia bacterium]|nr:hypothetical protein [Clostridia bacterium]